MAEEVKELKAKIKELEEQLKVNEKPLNIYQKLQRCRIEVQSVGITKSGKGYANFGYFELGDFLPTINSSCNKYGLTPIFKFEKEKASLTVIDSDNPEVSILFETPIELAVIMKGSAIQQIGATQTYARRYLYMMAFEIAETDLVEEVEPDQDKIEGEEKIGTVHANLMKKLIEETETEITSFLRYAGVSKVEDVKKKDYPELLKLLEKKKSDLKKKIDAEKARKQKEELAKQQEELKRQEESQQENFEF
ncbi:MAG: ERF family protein [Clostridium sp.]|uniref:ERF family protein n=1 Tax=Clostridium sp. TaxID=1506 RepID=UPI0029129979|nr:ERF family protein [Clostridium sp.]MDU5108862.1 ERF family protein [Clostridium sp.]